MPIVHGSCSVEEVPDPERVGVYRISRRIGEGGMGVVYLAERDDGEYKQHVALKILKPGPQQGRLLLVFPGSVARFSTPD